MGTAKETERAQKRPSSPPAPTSPPAAPQKPLPSSNKPAQAGPNQTCRKSQAAVYLANFPSTNAPMSAAATSTVYSQMTVSAGRGSEAGVYQQPAPTLADPRNDALCPALRKMGYSANVNDVIGEGSFSKVYRARSGFIPNRDIAVKIVRMDNPNIPQAWKEYSMKRELRILRRVKHPNVITIYDLIKTRTRIYIFMDLCAASVSSHLQLTEEPASEQTARNWFGGIANALTYLHTIGCAHRDIKNDNILIDSNGKAKLTDFGFACFTYDRQTRLEVLSQTICGTKIYVAPEVFDPPYNAKIADVWSLGVCLFEATTLHQPFREDLPLQVFVKRQRERGLVIPRRFQTTLSNWLQDLLLRMIEPDVNKRIRSEAVVVHPWMSMHLR